MGDVAGFPFIEVLFGKDGQPLDAESADRIVDLARTSGLTDLLVLSHGWNNDIADARTLYTDLLQSMRHVLDQNVAPALAGRTIGVMAVFWPSKKFADADLIPGGAASFDAAADALVKAKLEELKPVVDGPPDALSQAQALVAQLEDKPAARREFVDLVRSVLPRPSDSTSDASDIFFAEDGDELLKRLEAPAPPVAAAGDMGGAAGFDETGQAAGLLDVLGGIKAGALRLLNFVTYYQMKERAGRVGAEGVNPMLRKVRGQLPALKIHLVGHSFGGRLVTAVAQGQAGGPALGVSSMSLLQAAFSHNGFAPAHADVPVGFFRSVVQDGKVSGPIIVTHTANDKAVGVAYPLASRIAGQQASALGDENDVYGGIGRNGAVNTPGAVRATLLALPGAGAPNAYAFEGRKLYNLKADQIANHGDVSGKDVAFAILSAMAQSG